MIDARPRGGNVVIAGDERVLDVGFVACVLAVSVSERCAPNLHYCYAKGIVYPHVHSVERPECYCILPSKVKTRVEEAEPHDVSGWYRRVRN